MPLEKLEKSSLPSPYEFLLDRVAEALIESRYVDTSVVENNQKFILDGQLQVGAGEGVLALFQKDVAANPEDGGDVETSPTGEVTNELETIVSGITNLESIGISIFQREGVSNNLNIGISLRSDGFVGDITDLLFTDTNPLNVSQFIPLKKKQSVVDVEQAEEFLDTNIFELLPPTVTRQDRIDRLFQELNALLPPLLPQFDENDDGVVDRDMVGDWVNAEQYSQDNSISYAQDNPEDSNIDEEEAFIHRLKDTANDTNSDSTIEDIYNTVKNYLDDILEPFTPPQDDRQVYINQSSGYLQFRNLNQGIIIRNTNQEFVESLNPTSQEYLDTGFTITMWVRFLDKTSEGTLFNFGSPLRGDDTAFGFKLETYVLNKDDLSPDSSHSTWGDFDIHCQDRIDDSGTNDIYLSRYENSNTARYVRLVVNDGGVLRDSHTGVGGGEKQNEIPILGGDVTKDIALAQTTLIPENFQEWYFICATFNPAINEDTSFLIDEGPDNDGDGNPDGEQINPTDVNLSNSTNYWLNHIDPISGNTVTQSLFGNKCKVEIISKTDLLRSKGFKVD
jgi:hypothetical protein